MICRCIATLVYCEKHILNAEISVVNKYCMGLPRYWAGFCKILYARVR